MKVVVFLGPTLPVEVAQNILPDAVFRAPARQADILSCVLNDEPDVIGLIDGVFDQALSVWHKEILFALKEGVRVVGASSMGALRAVETAPFGMEGVGKIFEQYQNGELTDDDEVAIVHGPVDSNYYSDTLPMVNIRATFDKAVCMGIISDESRNRLVEAGKSIYFPMRNFEEIFAVSERDDPDNCNIEKLREFCQDNYVDLKAEDAVEMLKYISQMELVDKLTEGSQDYELTRNYMFNTLYSRDRLIRREGMELSLDTVTNYAAVHMESYNAVNFSSLNRRATLILADLMELEVKDEDVEKEVTRFFLIRKLYSEEEKREWLNKNDLTEKDFNVLMRENALCRRVHKYILTRNQGGSNKCYILEELKLQDKYEDCADMAAKREKILRENCYNQNGTDCNVNMSELVVEHMQNSNWNIDTHYKEWAGEAGFMGQDFLKYELLKARKSREILKEKLSTLLDL